MWRLGDDINRLALRRSDLRDDINRRASTDTTTVFQTMELSMPEYLGVQQRCEAAGLDIVEGWVGSTMGVVISDKIRSIYEQGERDDVLFLRPAPERDSTELEMQQEHVHVEQVQCPAIQQCHVCMAAQFKEIFCDSDMAALKEIADKFDKDGKRTR
jgi:hypothetical protein